MMTIYDFLDASITCTYVTYSIFDFNSLELLKEYNDDDAYEELKDSAYADLDIASYEMSIEDGCIHIDFTLDLDDDDRRCIAMHEGSEWRR